MGTLTPAQNALIKKIKEATLTLKKALKDNSTDVNEALSEEY